MILIFKYIITTNYVVTLKHASYDKNQIIKSWLLVLPLIIMSFFQTRIWFKFNPEDKQQHNVPILKREHVIEQCLQIKKYLIGYQYGQIIGRNDLLAYGCSAMYPIQLMQSVYERRKWFKYQGKMRLFSNNGTPLSFTDTDFKPLLNISAIKTPGGITGTCFSGQNFDKQILKVNSILDDKTLETLDATLNRDNFSIRWDGFMYFATSGKQTLCTVADDGVRLFLDNKKIIDDWSIHPPLRNCGEISVKQGWYPLKLEYFEAWGGEAIQLLSGDSENSLTQVPAQHLCCNQMEK